jgi:hypothetical protein
MKGEHIRRIGWFIVLWIGSVAALGLVAYEIRLVLYG